MRHYELMVILDPSLDERTVTPSLETFLNVVKNDGGTVEKIEIWGKRRLAFEIHKHAEGIYAVLEVAASPPPVTELDRQLGLNESVLRTKVLRREPKRPAPAPAARRAEAAAMAGETVITVVGNLTADPELRFTPSGAAVANFTVASTPRTFDRQSGEWKDGDALFMRCNVWRQAAENVAETLTRGMRVMVPGRLRQRSFETREGEKRTVVELEVDEVGPSLRYATAKVNKVSRGSGSGGFGGGGGGYGGGGGRRRQRRRLRWRQPAAATTTRGVRPRPPAAARPPTTSPPSERPIPPADRAASRATPGAPHHGQARPAQAEEEGLRVLQGQGPGHRLQGHRSAAEVHLRPRQDPGPPGHRQLPAAPA